MYNQTVAYPKKFYAFEELGKQRHFLSNNNTVVKVTDLGAGSKSLKSSDRTVSSIVKSSVKQQKVSEFIFKLINFYQPQYSVELGTSLGLTTMYIAIPRTNSKVYTFEGCANTLAVAKAVFKTNNINNVETVEGDINKVLKDKLSELPKLDFVFIDANHTYEATINYFETCLQKSHEDTVILIDDIYWSNQMKQAWKTIMTHPRVTVSIDFFHLGMILLRKNQPKQHFYLKL